VSEPEAAIGMAKDELDTPALLVDLEVMDANIARVARACREHGVNWRPHAKSHKTPEIAHRQLAAGAIGITCAKVGEAEVMARAGIRDILIANQVVGEAKIRRLMDLLEVADPIVAVDCVPNVAALSAAARTRGRKLRVVIEVNIGMDRAGVEPGAPVVELAHAVARHEGVRFAGLMGWESRAITIADPGEKARAVAAAVGLLTDSAHRCRRAGHPVEVVSCGGTGTFPYCVQQPGVTEVQVGGGIFSDMHYRTHFHCDFDCALTVLCTVTSRPTPTRVILDAGLKSMSGDAALPQPLGLPAIRILRFAAEHLTLELAEASPVPAVGDRVEFIAGYSDTTVHLHERIVATRQGRVAAVWRVAGRGKTQ
jgi:D-serine deaminase-like pyridoxal phosphate-dependent protein